MHRFKLPDPFSALTPLEKEALYQLPWSHGPLSECNKPDRCFIVTAGQVWDETGRYYEPGEHLLGIRPFMQNPKHSYQGSDDAEIQWIETNILGQYFLTFPKAMQSFVWYENNTGSEISADWSRFPRIWNIVTLQSSWQGIHFGLNICHRLTSEHNKKCLYIEMQRDGMSVYSFIDREPSVPLAQSKEDEKDPALALMGRTITHDDFDIVNGHYLSPWELDKNQWAAVFWAIAKKYDHVVIHSGTHENSFIHEQCDGLFVMRKFRTMGYGAYHPEENLSFWPLAMEIYTSDPARDGDQVIHYPVFYKDIIDVEKIPLEEKSSDQYWEWFDRYPGRMLYSEKAVILGENFSADVPYAYYIEKEKREIISPEFFQKNIVIAEGTTGLFLLLEWFTGKPGQWMKKILKKMKIIYPKTGFFKRKTFIKNLPGKVERANQSQLGLVLSSWSAETENIQFLHHGNISENLARSSFPDSVMEQDKIENRKRELHSSGPANWNTLLATCFRVGLKTVQFYKFHPSGIIEPVNYLSNYIQKIWKLSRYSSLAGKRAFVYDLFPALPGFDSRDRSETENPENNEITINTP